MIIIKHVQLRRVCLFVSLNVVLIRIVVIFKIFILIYFNLFVINFEEKIN